MRKTLNRTENQIYRTTKGVQRKLGKCAMHGKSRSVQFYTELLEVLRTKPTELDINDYVGVEVC